MASISFTGDIAFSKYFKDHWNKDFLDKRIMEFFKNSDHVVANVEAPLSDCAMSSEREINHFSSPESVNWFKKISADIWAIANNHILDCGEAGMHDTMTAAQSIGAVTVGAGVNVDEASKPITLDCAGGIGICAVTYKRGEFIRASDDAAGCVLFDDPKRIQNIINEIKSKNRWCIIIAHGGDEFSNLPMPYIRKLYRKFLKMGADIVVGHHPHVVQNYEKIGEKMIFYSLGNFVFDTDYQRKQKYSEYGILLKINFDDTAFTWDYIATRVNRTTQTVEKAEPPEIFCDLDKRSYRLLWPLAARNFTKNFIVAKTFVIPKTRTYNSFNWFNAHREKIGLKNTLCLYFGKLLSYLSAWKLAPKAIRDYIAQK